VIDLFLIAQAAVRRPIERDNLSLGRSTQR
jgi:hypothetical protein